MSRVIDMTGIVKTYNIDTPNELTVLHGIDFHVNYGEFVSIVGSSGSGKSTMMNIIGLLDRPTEGKYLLSGTDTAGLKDDAQALFRSQHIGFVFQNFNLISRISALKNVEIALMYAGVPAKERREHAGELMAQVGMDNRGNHLPSELSGGQKQRVAIARALANNPDIILADEPTGALDTHTGRLVMDLFHELHEQGRTIVFITHNPELAQETSRIVQMSDGVIL
ncbi:MAG: ABC transporter ATP-binding protein [Corynebacterium sp.]|nr:ABC transporter ATP-binding protein [Corynebacterium sp.]